METQSYGKTLTDAIDAYIAAPSPSTANYLHEAISRVELELHVVELLISPLRRAIMNYVHAVALIQDNLMNQYQEIAESINQLNSFARPFSEAEKKLSSSRQSVPFLPIFYTSLKAYNLEPIVALARDYASLVKKRDETQAIIRDLANARVEARDPGSTFSTERKEVELEHDLTRLNEWISKKYVEIDTASAPLDPRYASQLPDRVEEKLARARAAVGIIKSELSMPSPKSQQLRDGLDLLHKLFG